MPAKGKCKLTKEESGHPRKSGATGKKEKILDWSKKMRLQKRGLEAKETTDDK